MLLRLVLCIIGLFGMVPLLYKIRTRATIESDDYQYAAVGLSVSFMGLLFGMIGGFLGVAIGLLAFKMKENLVCDLIECILRRIKPYLMR